MPGDGRLPGAGIVLGGVALGGATLTAPGVVEQKTARVPLRFGELDGRATDRAQRLHQALTRAGIEAVLSEDIVRDIWEKLIFASFSQALTALTRLPLGPLMACPETAELARGIIAEAVTVGRAKGVGLPDDAAERFFEYGRRYALVDPLARASMSFDLIAGRRLELEAINGAIVRLGRAFSIPTPLNGAMYAALKPFADGASSPSGRGLG
jgi:2-dehydropantoate 2-reductase